MQGCASAQASLSHGPEGFPQPCATLEVEVEDMDEVDVVIGMEWLIGCLAGSFARQRYANSKNLHRRSADCLAWNDAPHPSGTTLQGRTAQCMCIVK